MSKSFFIETYGCEMNKSDSIDIGLALEEKGYVRAAHGSEADIVVLNTCSVRQHAERRVFGRLGYYKSLGNREKGPPVIVLTGCMAQLIGEDAKKRFPEIVFVLDGCCI